MKYRLLGKEHGVRALYITARKDDPNTFVFYEIYRSHAALDFHLQQDFTKKFLATLKSVEEDAIRHARDTLAVRDPFFPLWFSKYWPYSARLSRVSQLSRHTSERGHGVSDRVLSRR